ncbi:MAG: DUF1329 domain-containing protein [Candidatus Dadabacteria bacterium]|nr:MAG: DUF1329 domain-containing protein [Candidatus Dadabacteria bacterium]
MQPYFCKRIISVAEKYAIIVALCFLVVPYSSFADDAVMVPKMPEVVKKLASASKEISSRTIIKAANLKEYSTIILPELKSLIERSGFEIQAASKLRYRWRYDDLWEKTSDTPLADDLLLKDGSLKELVPMKRGYLFGDWQQLLQQQQEDLGQKARKIMWNIESVRWSQPYSEAEFRLVRNKKENKIAEFSGSLTRVYTRAVNPADRSIQLFREKLSFQTPAVLNGLSFLTLRFFGPDEDMLWEYSPAIKKVRQLTGSNRTDPLVGSYVSLDDLFVWSGKQEQIKVSGDLKLQSLLSPFYTLDMTRAIKDQANKGCVIINIKEGQESPISEATSSLFYDEKTTIQPSSVLMADAATFVPRFLWRVSLLSRDPYSLYGRQVLYVDVYSMLPVLKVVYDRAGRLWKLVAGFAGLALDIDSKIRFPFYSDIFVYDFQKHDSSLMSFRNFRYCSRLPQNVSLESLTPTGLAPQVAQHQEEPNPINDNFAQNGDGNNTNL